MAMSLPAVLLGFHLFIDLIIALVIMYRASYGKKK